MPTHDTRHARLFRNGRSQAVRIPREFELPVSEVTIHREGRRLIIEPVEAAPLRELFAQWTPLDETFPDIVDLPPEPVDIE
ncbi:MULTISPECIES: antitoxin [Burkholderia]|uniref:AbrB/MazE/SpoVT family DNA-binding domain-containing protein n=1 Tax=Burkholderia anthinoferrum TaxID=3090833 RepID=A0ABU5WW23_9BURK|nr:MULTISPECIES: AbrB/MazE/SpoVT family DNA-binding domain-containing protein [Burkholderia]MEB2507342.1 AbrB/MazE/SpoVT family DNA-binding domain-containing protein [Burkholderia anthinoferrum]MEB2535947.1 AbrB/MazE/SpoVT family DNA-binding domain-containing protein [Burkholderia anthinoferrum]MEB2565147.1 AbrB/MazE/SpoVT family DNA-binding domain-containing protein [Burkholderia anthinoferrum]MEB2583172.1 AbrB/MazE/SpoVT family DNA-binding domain-containing protein [Burkholderia anthinoferrum